jgi:hypothetical protein
MHYVPEGIVGHKQGIKFYVDNKCADSGDGFIFR